MLDVGWSELLVLGVLALLVVGPRELPRLMRTVGQWVNRARTMARDFQRGMEDVAREADIQELAEARKMMDDVRSIKSDVQKGLPNPGSWAKEKVKTAVAGDGPDSATSGSAPAVADAAKPAKAEPVASEVVEPSLAEPGAAVAEAPVEADKASSG